MPSRTAPDPVPSDPSPLAEPSTAREGLSEPEVGDTLELLLGQKGLLLASVVLFGALGAAYTVSTRPIYEVKATILMPQTRAVSGAASLAASLGVAGLGGGGGGDSLPMFRKILESDTVTTAVSGRCGVKKRDLRKMAAIDDDAKTNTIDLTVQNRDQGLALRIANEYIRQLGVENTRLSLPGKSRKAQLIGASLNSHARALAVAEDRLKDFVSTASTSPGLPASSGGRGGDDVGAAAGPSPVFRYRDQLTTLGLQLDRLNSQLGLIDAKSTEASRVQPLDFPPVATWRVKLNELAAKLAEVRGRYSEDSAEVREAKRQYDQVNRLMQGDIAKYIGAVQRRVTGNVSQLDQDRAAITGQIAAIRALANAAPRESLEYQRLVRDVTTLSSLVSQFRVQYEQAKLESADDPNRWEILDKPTVGEDPINKKYSRNVSLAAIGGLLLAMPLALRRAKRRA